MIHQQTNILANLGIKICGMNQNEPDSSGRKSPRPTKKNEWIHFSIHVETGAWTSGKRCASVGNLEQQEDPEKHTPTQETHIGNMKQLQSGKKKKKMEKEALRDTGWILVLCV